MFRALAPPLLALIAATMMGAAAEAGCACMCVDGNMVAALHERLGHPADLSDAHLRPADHSTALRIGTRRACVDTQVCDQYGHCEWQPVCQ